MHTIFPPCDDCLSVISDPEDDFRPLTPSGLDLLTSSGVTFLSPISSRPQIPSNPASPDEPPSLTLLATSQPPTVATDVAPSTLIGSQLPISPPEVSQSEDNSELPPFSSFLSDVRPLLSRPNQLKLRPDPPVLGRQHRREYYTNHARRTRRPALINNYNTVLNQSSVSGKYSFGIANVKNKRFKTPISPLNDWLYHHRPSPHSLINVAQPSCASFPPPSSILI